MADRGGVDTDEERVQTGRAERLVDEIVDELRPWLRGSFHRWGVPVAVVLTVVLAVRAHTGGERATVIVYGVCLSLMLSSSGLLHARRFSDRPRRVLRRLDHAMIHVGIAGTYTAVMVLALDGATRVVLLIVAWTLAVLGVITRMLWMDARRGLIAAVYLVAGWQLMIDLPAYRAGMRSLELGLLAAGGMLYTIGAVLFALRRPDPWPRVYGYHEVWHTFVVAAAFLHWLSIYLLLD